MRNYIGFRDFNLKPFTSSSSLITDFTSLYFHIWRGCFYYCEFRYVSMAITYRCTHL